MQAIIGLIDAMATLGVLLAATTGQIREVWLGFAERDPYHRLHQPRQRSGDRNPSHLVVSA